MNGEQERKTKKVGSWEIREVKRMAAITSVRDMNERIARVAVELYTLIYQLRKNQMAQSVSESNSSSKLIHQKTINQLTSDGEISPSGDLETHDGNTNPKRAA